MRSRRWETALYFVNARRRAFPRSSGSLAREVSRPRLRRHSGRLFDFRLFNVVFGEAGLLAFGE